MANNDDDTRHILGSIESRLGQIEASVNRLQRDVSEIAGGLAVVLNRSDENKVEIKQLSADLDDNKKKQPAYKPSSDKSSNSSWIDLQKTMLVLRRWKASQQ